MSETITLGISGIGAFVPGAPDWPSLREVLLDRKPLDTNAPARPAASILAAAERRRAPDGVLLAAEVARQACSMARSAPADLPCVFASTHGEIAITDYVCATLARAPLELSPTKFHNSVLNAPAGYWTIATGCRQASSAISARHCSFGAGLLEAAALARSDRTPVLLVLCDVAATGPLLDIMQVCTAFATALVLTADGAGTPLRLTLADTTPAPAVPQPTAPALHAVAATDPTAAQALALLTLLAVQQPARVAVPLSSGLTLTLEVAQ